MASDSAGNRFDGRVAVITGAGRGIGRALALLMASEGASLVVNDLGANVDGSETGESPADDVVKEITDAGGAAVASHHSVVDFESAEEIVKTAVDAFGRIDVLCHAAGILRDRMVFNMSEEEWDGVLRTHLYGAFNMVRNTVPHMIAQEYGRIVLFASSSGLGAAGQANYSSAKEGMVGFARALSQELAEYDISVNAVYPGALTRMLANVPDSTRQMLRGQVEASNEPPFGPAEMLASYEPDEAMTPEANAPKVAYLCTEAGGAITGEVIGTSGWTMSLFTPRYVSKSIHKDGRWTLDELERLMPASLAAGLKNPAPTELPKD